MGEEGKAQRYPKFKMNCCEKIKGIQRKMKLTNKIIKILKFNLKFKFN